jgi:hypothetical protein
MCERFLVEPFRDREIYPTEEDSIKRLLLLKETSRAETLHASSGVERIMSKTGKIVARNCVFKNKLEYNNYMDLLPS